MADVTVTAAQAQYDAINGAANYLKSTTDAKVQQPDYPQSKNSPGQVQGPQSGLSVNQHPAFNTPYGDGVAPDNPNGAIEPNANPEAVEEFMQNNPQHTYTPALTPAPTPGLAPQKSYTPEPRPY